MVREDYDKSYNDNYSDGDDVDDDVDDDDDDDDDDDGDDLGDAENDVDEDDDEDDDDDDIGDEPEPEIGEAEKETEIEMGKAIRNQLRIWDNLLCLRIRFQKILIEANQLPNPAFFAELKDIPPNNNSPGLDSVIQQCFNSFSVLTDNLLGLQELMITKNSETKQIITRTNKAAAGVIGGKGDEEITSSDDDDEDLKKIENEDSDKSENDEEDVENEEDGEEKEKNSLKRKRISDYSEEITKRFKSLVPFRNETIEKWNTKTEVASGKFKNKGAAYSNFHVSTMKQINQVLTDKERLVRRTQLKRSQYLAIGESDNVEVKKRKIDDEGEVDEKKSDSSEQDNYNEEIFDDDDFYHQLLREVIERKTSNVHDPAELSSRWLELQKIRGKTKRKVDTKSSKGRKIRYTVLPKLVNFMAPHDECPMTENAYKELLNSLFAN